MMPIRSIVFALAAELLCSTCCLAGLIVSIDMDTAQSGIQASRTVSVNEEFDVGVVFELTGTTSLSSYGFSVRFDTVELDFISRTETPPSPLNELDTSNPFSDIAGSGDPILGAGNFGSVRRFDGLTLATGPTAPAGPFTVATLRFKAIAPTGDLSDIDLRAGIFESGFDDFFDNSGTPINSVLTFNHGSVNAVPEPSTVALVLTLSLVGLARGAWRKRRQTLDRGRRQESSNPSVESRRASKGSS